MESASCTWCTRTTKSKKERRLTLSRVHVLDGDVGSDGLVLPVDEDPESEIGLGKLEVGGDSSLEGLVGLVLEHSEDGKVRRRDVLVVERGKVEPLVLLEGLVGDDLRRRKGDSASSSKDNMREAGRTDLRCEVEMLLLLLPLLGVELYPLVLESLSEMRRGVGLGEGLENLVDGALSDVDQHVGVGEPLRGSSCVIVVVVSRLVPSGRGEFSSVVVLENLLVGDGGDSVVVVLEPLSVLLRLDQGEVVSAVKVSGVDEDSVKLVDVVVVSLGVLVEVLSEVELEGELVTVVDLVEEDRDESGRVSSGEEARDGKSP